MAGHDGVVDVHSHFFPANIGGRTPEGEHWPRLDVDEGNAGRILVGAELFRLVEPSLWDVPTRLAQLDQAGVDIQLVSPVPIMLTYWAGSRDGLAFSRAVNDGIAEAVSASGGRLLGLGTLPLPHVAAAAEELRRLVVDLGLRGVEIGTQVGGLELDDPALLPFFRAAEELDAVIFVHPVDGGGGAVRRGGRLYDFGLGMLTDTALAASALVFGGVLEACPGLRVVMAHGCGTFAAAYPRLRLAEELWRTEYVAAAERAIGSLWVDSLVFDPETLALLVGRFGRDRVMLGTDYPFFAGELTKAQARIADARGWGCISDDVVELIRSSNARAFLRL